MTDAQQYGKMDTAKLNAAKEVNLITMGMLTATEIEHQRQEFSAITAQELGDIMKPLADRLHELVVKHSGEN